MSVRAKERDEDREMKKQYGREHECVRVVESNRNSLRKIVSRMEMEGWMIRSVDRWTYGYMDRLIYG